MNSFLDFHWQQIVMAPRWQRHLIIISVCLLLGFIGWIGIISPLTAENARLKTQRFSLQQANETYQQRQRDYAPLQWLKPQSVRFKQRLEHYSLSAADVAESIQAMSAFIRQAGCKLVDIRKLPETRDEPFTLLRWKVKIQADYFQFMAFMQLLNTSDYLFAVDELMIESDALLTLEMTLVLHQLSEALP